MVSYQRRLITSIIPAGMRWKDSLSLELIIRRWYQMLLARSKRVWLLPDSGVMKSPRHTNDPKERSNIFKVGKHALLSVAAATPVLRDKALSVERYAYWLLIYQNLFD